jgi:hypothetical protein
VQEGQEAHIGHRPGEAGALEVLVEQILVELLDHAAAVQMSPVEPDQIAVIGEESSKGCAVALVPGIRELMVQAADELLVCGSRVGVVGHGRPFIH